MKDEQRIIAGRLLFFNASGFRYFFDSIKVLIKQISMGLYGAKLTVVHGVEWTSI